MSRTLALTGATGFIGGALLGELVSCGWRVRALHRRPVGLRSNIPSVEWVQGSLGEPEALRRLVDGVTAVVHCAGRVRGVSSRDFERVNVDGTAALARAAGQQARPPRFLLLSSLAAREPDVSGYAASKRRGEDALDRTAGDMPWMVLRPPAVYGPGDRDVVPLLRWIGRGLAPALGPRGARFSLLHVADLSGAVLRALSGEVAPGGVFELHDGQPGGYSWEDLIERIAGLRGRRIRTIRVPAGALGALAILNASLARGLGYAPRLTPGKVRELRHPNWVCDNTAYTQATGWTPRVSLEEGLRLTLGWTSIAACDGNKFSATGGPEHRRRRRSEG
jgi:nucleoside-diphosphate-sugar epimerase